MRWAPTARNCSCHAVAVFVIAATYFSLTRNEIVKELWRMDEGFLFGNTLQQIVQNSENNIQ